MLNIHTDCVIIYLYELMLGERKMDYMYGAIFLMAGLMLIFKLSKENKIFYFAGAYFLVFGGWWIANALTPEVDLFSGTPGIVFKVISGVALVVFLVFWYLKIWKPEHDKKKKS